MNLPLNKVLDNHPMDISISSMVPDASIDRYVIHKLLCVVIVNTVSAQSTDSLHIDEQGETPMLLYLEASSLWDLIRLDS